MRFTDGMGRRMGRRRRRGAVNDVALESDAAGVAMRASILGSSQGSHLPPPPEEERPEGWVDPGLVEHTRPDVRPHPKAQWDDAEGHWIIWNAEAGAWERYG